MVKKIVTNKDKRKETIKRQIKENSIVINKGIFFLPEDLKKLKGKWSLYIKKGLLTKIK
jgi:hypothetical protein